MKKIIQSKILKVSILFPLLINKLIRTMSAQPTISFIERYAQLESNVLSIINTVKKQKEYKEK